MSSKFASPVMAKSPLRKEKSKKRSVNNVGSALTHKTKETHIHPTEFTGKIQAKEDGQEYSLIDLEANQKVRDTLKPAGLKFNKSMVDKDGYLKGSLDLPAVQTGNKTFTLKEEGTK